MHKAIKNILIAFQQGDLEQRRSESGSQLTADDVLDNLAATLKRRMENLKASNDITHGTLAKRLYRENKEYGRKIMEAAAFLHENSTDKNDRRIFLNKHLEGKLRYLSAINYFTQDGKKSLPKESRLYFFADVIVAWKIITGDAVIPPREQVKESVFSDFLEQLFSVGGLVERGLSVDEAHRHILKIEQEMAV